MKDSIPSKYKVRKCVETSLKTVGVGSLSIFEYHFGHLWGLGKPEEELTDEERAYRDRWMEARQEIFDRLGRSNEIATGILDRFSISEKGYFNEKF